MTVGTAHSKAKCTFRRGGARETAPTAPTPAPDERWPLSGLQAGDSAREGYSAGGGAGAGKRSRRRVHGGALLLGPLMFRWTTCVRLDHLSSVGPPYSMNQVAQRNISGPTAFKWSKQIGRVTTCETPSHHARRSAGWSKGGAPEPPPTSPSPPRFPAPSSPPPSTTLRITPGQRIQAPPNNLPGGEGLIRTGRHRNPHAPRLHNHP